MAARYSQTLDTDGQTFELPMAFGTRAVATMNITSPCTVTWTYKVASGESAIQLKKADGTTDAIYTASDVIQFDAGGGVAIATVSGISASGQCVFEGDVGRAC